MTTVTNGSEKLDRWAHVRLDGRRAEALQAMAEEASIGVSDVLRRAIDRELARKNWAQCECGVGLTKREATGQVDAIGCLCDGYGGFLPPRSPAAPAAP